MAQLRITFEAGEIVRVSVNAGLDSAYQRLFEAAHEQLHEPEPPIEAGIQLIVFGCFWLEAVCNEVLRDLMRGAVKPRAVGEAAWEALKRASFHAKFSTVSGFAKAPEAAPSESIARDLAALFGLRNRLAHFKDEDALAAGPLTLDDFRSQFEQFPDAELIAQLRPPAVDHWAAVILTATRWVTEVRQQYFPTSTVDQSEESQ